ncbi:MAG: uracil-DNA glycosylase [Treponema sp.]|nr:uracil-DNA glycosylase [Treponema sp.]
MDAGNTAGIVAGQHIRTSGDGSMDEGKAAALPPTATETETGPAAVSPAGITLHSIEEKISRCQNCRLASTRKNTVPGEGSQHPVVMVVGEGPGEMEDRSGRPFVGPAGQLLDRMLAAISLSRTSNCYIANIVKCRPPHNRDPYPDEEEACSPFLEAQIHILKPKVILALGNIAAKKLLNTSEGISRLRGRFYDYNGIPLTATYHPSALLHNETLKRPAWEDLKVLRAWLEENAPGYDTPFRQQA